MSKKTEKMLKAFIKEHQVDNAQIVIQNARTGHLKTWIAVDADMEKENAGKLITHSCAGSLVKPFLVAMAMEKYNLSLDSVYNGMSYMEGIKRADADVMLHAFSRGFGKEYAERVWRQMSSTAVPVTGPLLEVIFYTSLVNDGAMMTPTTKGDSVEVEKDLAEVLRVNRTESPQLAWLTDATSWYGYAASEEIKEGGADSVKGKQIQFAGVFPADAPRYTICVVADKLSTDATAALLKDIVNPLAEWLLKQK